MGADPGFPRSKGFCQDRWRGQCPDQYCRLGWSRVRRGVLIRSIGTQRRIFIGFPAFAARTDAQTVVLDEPRKKAVTLPPSSPSLSGTPSGRGRCREETLAMLPHYGCVVHTSRTHCLESLAAVKCGCLASVYHSDAMIHTRRAARRWMQYSGRLSSQRLGPCVRRQRVSQLTAGGPTMPEDQMEKFSHASSRGRDCASCG